MTQSTSSTDIKTAASVYQVLQTLFLEHDPSSINLDDLEVQLSRQHDLPFATIQHIVSQAVNDYKANGVRVPDVEPLQTINPKLGASFKQYCFTFFRNNPELTKEELIDFIRHIAERHQISLAEAKGRVVSTRKEYLKHRHEHPKHSPSIKTDVRPSQLLGSKPRSSPQERDHLILKLIAEVRVAARALHLSEIPKATFYRRVNNLVEKGLLIPVKASYPREYIVRSVAGLGKSQNSRSGSGPSLTSPSASDSPPSPEWGSVVGSSVSGTSSPPPPQGETSYPNIPPTSSQDPAPPSDDPHLARITPPSPPPRSEDPSEGDDLASFDPLLIRSHNYIFVLPIQRAPANVLDLIRRYHWFEVHPMNNWYQCNARVNLEEVGWVPGGVDLGDVMHATIQVNTRKVVVRISNIFGRSSWENDSQAGEYLLQVKDLLERTISGLVVVPTPYIRRWESRKTHHAWVHHPLALKAKQQNVTLQGHNWEIDSSHGMPELEAVHELDANHHISEELEDFEYRSETGTYFRDLDRRGSENREGIVHLTRQFEQTSVNNLEIAQLLKETARRLGEGEVATEQIENTITQVSSHLSQISSNQVEMTRVVGHLTTKLEGLGRNDVLVTEHLREILFALERTNSTNQQTVEILKELKDKKSIWGRTKDRAKSVFGRGKKQLMG